MSIFKVYFDYLNFTEEDIEEFLYGEYGDYTDIDNSHSYEFSPNYTIEVGEDELPF